MWQFTEVYITNIFVKLTGAVVCSNENRVYNYVYTTFLEFNCVEST
jgi:hypothetical protein